MFNLTFDSPAQCSMSQCLTMSVKLGSELVGSWWKCPLKPMLMPTHLISCSYNSGGVNVKIRNQWKKICILLIRQLHRAVTYRRTSIWFNVGIRFSFANVAAMRTWEQTSGGKKKQPRMYRPLHTNWNSTFVIVMICVPTSLQSMSVASPEGLGISGCLCCETRRWRRHGSWLKSPWEISEGVRSWWGKLKQSGQSRKGENHRISSQTERYQLMMWKSIKDGFLL